MNDFDSVFIDEAPYFCTLDKREKYKYLIDKAINIANKYNMRLTVREGMAWGMDKNVTALIFVEPDDSEKRLSFLFTLPMQCDGDEWLIEIENELIKIK